jgi:hypothetical protein
VGSIHGMRGAEIRIHAIGSTHKQIDGFWFR